MLGPRGLPFDNDEVLSEIDDEDLKSDPITQIDMKVYRCNFCIFLSTNVGHIRIFFLVGAPPGILA